MDSLRPLIAWALLRRRAPTLHPGDVLRAFGDIDALLEADTSLIRAVLGCSLKRAKDLASPEAQVEARIEVEASLSGGDTLLSWDDPAYPLRLREITNPPALLNLQGSVAALQGPCLAIVGSRDCTLYGEEMAREIARTLAAAGFVIVSGGARGIDAAAHRGALSVGGATIAVRGSGLGIDYPKGHRHLYEEMSSLGASLGEYAPGILPRRPHFPRRNRIIAGLSLGVVVVEAALKSGALVTARLALEENREVFAVPGALDNPRAMGTNLLIQQGAKLVMSPDDIIGEISPQLRPPPTELASNATTLGEVQRSVLNCLQSGPRHVDEIDKLTSLQPGQLVGVMLQMELEGWVSPCPGGRYRLGSPFGAA